MLVRINKHYQLIIPILLSGWYYMKPEEAISQLQKANTKNAEKQ